MNYYILTAASHDLIDDIFKIDFVKTFFNYADLEKYLKNDYRDIAGKNLEIDYSKSDYFYESDDIKVTWHIEKKEIMIKE